MNFYVSAIPETNNNLYFEVTVSGWEGPAKAPVRRIEMTYNFITDKG